MSSQTILILGGGNAIGAYLAGAYETIHARGIEPDWVIGASVGAITSALIAGNAPDKRVDQLRKFWAEAQTWSPLPQANDKQRQYANGWHSALAAMFGRPTIFRHRWPGFFGALPGTPNDIALYDHAPLAATLKRLVDFDRLNGGEVRFSANTIDIETGEEIVFDTTRDRIRPEHILASTAITPGFPQIEIDGRMLCDPGYVNNTPIDIALGEPPSMDTLCIAVELFSLQSPRPKSLDAVIERTQDIMFASPTRRSIAALGREYRLRAQLQMDLPIIKLLHSIYQPPPHELSLKTLDFSSRSINDRWNAGADDLTRGLDKVDASRSSTPGLKYFSPHPPTTNDPAAKRV